MLPVVSWCRSGMVSTALFTMRFSFLLLLPVTAVAAAILGTPTGSNLTSDETDAFTNIEAGGQMGSG